MLVLEVVMLEAEVVMVESFHRAKKEEIGMVLGVVWHLETIKAEVVMVVTTVVILAKMEVLTMAKVLWITYFRKELRGSSL